MLPEKRLATHPGEVLLLDFLNPMGVTQVELARHLSIPVQRVNEIIKGKRNITPETAWLFARALGTSPEFWINLQAAHDLTKAREGRGFANVTRIGMHPTATRPEQGRAARASR